MRPGLRAWRDSFRLSGGILLCIGWLLLPPNASAALLGGPDGLRQFLAATPGGKTDVVLLGPRDFLGSTFLPAAREGMLSSLSIVLPVDSPLTEEDVASWNAHVAALTSAGDNGFVLINGTIRGKIATVPVAVSSLSSAGADTGSGPVVLDVAFLLSLFKDEGRTPFTGLPQKVLSILDSRGMNPARLVAWVPDRQEIPLERGYLPKLLSDFTSAPDSFRNSLPPKWQTIGLAEQLAWLGFHEQAISHFEAYLKQDPAEPSVLYRVALLMLVDRDTDRALRYLHRAFEADPYYIRGYAAAAFVLYRKGELDDAERILRAGLHLDPAFPDLKAGMGRTLLAQAVRIFQRDPVAAGKRYGEISALQLAPDLEKQIASEWEAAKAAPPAAVPGTPPGHGSGGHGR